MIFLIIIKNTWSEIEMPNTVLGDASRLIPDPCSVSAGGLPVNISGIWDQMSDYKNVAMVNNPLVYWPSFTGGQLIPEPLCEFISSLL